ncbi:MAG TPA: N-acetylglucosamine-6-phosphate deacetylase [Magnetospirillaceae bacterium]|jgi:N-acetylglucosamine-6-phosphate deacetylase
MSATPSTPKGSILTTSGWVSGTVSIGKDGRIAAIEGKLLYEGAALEPPFIVPGYIDLHVHGGHGHECMSGETGVRKTLAYHASHGTVAMTPSTVTAPVEVIESALTDIVNVQKKQQAGESAVLGAHLEGPFINPGRLGAQAPYPHAGEASLAEDWAKRFPIVVATVAPEIVGGMDVIKVFAEHRCRVQVGHTLASQEQVDNAFACGCTGFTHLFNAMSGVSHRAPGVATWALAHAEYAEIIADLNHIHPQVILMARRAIPKLYTVTDASAAAGMPDGEYMLGDRKVIKRGMKVVLKEQEDTLASSVITLADAVRNLVSIGLPLAEAVAMASTRPADYLGLDDLGRIKPGARASMVQLDGQLQVRGVWIDGEGIDVAA